MKYIRTKDKIYAVTNNKYEVFEENGVFKIHCENMGHHWDSELEVIAQAETIEELCDGFYNDILNDFDCFGFDTLYIYDDFESFKADWKGYRTHDNWKGDGYGFIKTSKGLTYVAKMNENGDLKLIWERN